MAGISLFGNIDKLKAILGFCNSKVAEKYMEFLAPTINIKLNPILSMPYSLESTEENEIIRVVDELISIYKSDWDTSETSKDFIKHPLL